MTSDITEIYRSVRLDLDHLSERSFDHYREKHKNIYLSLSASRKAQVLDDFRTHVSYLQESLATRSGAIFFDYSCWAKALYSPQHLPSDYLPSSLAALDDILNEELPPDYRDEADAIIKKSIRLLDTCPEPVPSYITGENPRASVARTYLDALLVPDRERARNIINGAVESGIPVRDVYLNIIQPVLRETGRLWQTGKISVAKEHYVSASVQLVISRLHNQIVSSVKRPPHAKTVVTACVENEFHEVGIQIVTAFFEMDGWDTYLIGANTPAESLLESARERNADVVAISSTMAADLPRVDYLIRSLRATPATNRAKIIVGGYPFTVVPDLWKRIGADAFAIDAEEAVAVANRLTAK